MFGLHHSANFCAKTSSPIQIVRKRFALYRFDKEMLSRKNERKRKLRKIQDESNKNNSKQKENHVYRLMIPCGRIKKTNNHVCASV